MKRLFSFMMALVLILSLGVTAFAVGETGTITIKNATKDQTYRLFKIFDARPAEGAPDKVAYTIKSGDAFYEAMFGTNGLDADNNGKKDAHDVFDYTEETGVITLKSGMTETQVSEYLTKLIAAYVDKEDLDLAVKVSPTQTAIASGHELKFEDLEPGYYVIDRGIKTTVTIDTNTPNVTVIDKNQTPGTGFDKLVWDENAPVYDDNGVVTGHGGWVVQNSASVGDVLKWDISFEATNYARRELVEYYSVKDTKDSALWVEFNNIRVFIVTQNADGTETTEELKRGYYFYAGYPKLNTNEWTLLGSGWTPAEKQNAEQEIQNDFNADRTVYHDADWYMIHYGYDNFEIVIPWLQEFKFTGVKGTDETQGGDEKLGGYAFEFKEDDKGNIIADHRYDPTVTVHITYTASVGPGASLEGAENTANLSWKTVSNTYRPDNPQTTTTNVYNMGITKVADDGGPNKEATKLAGAVFELYRDKACTEPIYVIPTNETGVYVVDDVFNILSGHKRVSSRDKYSIITKDDNGNPIDTSEWYKYITAIYKDENGVEKKYAETITKEIDGVTIVEDVRRDMTTPATGQLIILGLEKGTYYMKETVPPEGYNQLAAPVEIKVAMNGDNAIDAKVEGKDTIVYNATVVNQQGLELPSTGGEGTMMMITFGSVVAMIFAVLMITQKKMSIYKD